MEILKDKIVTTRKLHNCWGCRCEIPIGSKVRYVTNVDAGNILSTYLCDICQELISEMDYWETEDGFTYGEIIDNMKEEWIEAKKSLMIGG